jgi:hypothetical protein
VLGALAEVGGVLRCDCCAPSQSNHRSRDLGYRKSGDVREGAAEPRVEKIQDIGVVSFRLSILSCCRSQRPYYLPGGRAVVVAVGRMSSMWEGGSS